MSSTCDGQNSLLSAPSRCRQEPFDNLYQSSDEAVQLLQECYSLSKSVDNPIQRAQCLKSCKKYMWSTHFPECINNVALLPCAENCEQFHSDCQIDLASTPAPSPCAKKGELCERGPSNEPGNKFFNRDGIFPSVFRYGYNAPGNATVLCKQGHCEDVTNYQRFFCYNKVLRIAVKCQSSTWDDHNDLCNIVNQYDPGCKSKSCVNNFRLFIGASSTPFCQKITNPPGNEEKWMLCGHFQSNDPTNRVVAVYGAYSLSGGPVFKPTGPFCKSLYNQWVKNAPISSTDDLAFAL